MFLSEVMRLAKVEQQMKGCLNKANKGIFIIPFNNFANKVTGSHKIISPGTQGFYRRMQKGVQVEFRHGEGRL